MAKQKKNKILVIDNYDSFTYNIVQYLEEIGAHTLVFRNDQIEVSEILKINPFAIVISPGPCSPNEAGISNTVIERFSGKVPILGVCLGHQCIGHVFGGNIIRAKNIMHGKTSDIYHDKKGLFLGIPSPFRATRYHSLLIKSKTCPSVLKVTAKTKAGEIMGVQHKAHPTFGVQFHPESVMTEHGHRLLRNFLELSKQFYQAPALSRENTPRIGATKTSGKRK